MVAPAIEEAQWRALSSMDADGAFLFAGAIISGLHPHSGIFNRLLFFTEAGPRRICPRPKSLVGWSISVIFHRTVQPVFPVLMKEPHRPEVRLSIWVTEEQCKDGSTEAKSCHWLK